MKELELTRENALPTSEYPSARSISLWRARIEASLADKPGTRAWYGCRSLLWSPWPAYAAIRFGQLDACPDLHRSSATGDLGHGHHHVRRSSRVHGFTLHISKSVLYGKLRYRQPWTSVRRVSGRGSANLLWQEDSNASPWKRAFSSSRDLTRQAFFSQTSSFKHSSPNLTKLSLSSEMSA